MVVREDMPNEKTPEESATESGTPTKVKRRAGKRKTGRRKKGSGKKTPRSTRPFPKVLLSKAVEIAQKIKELNGGNPWTPVQIAEAIGIGPRSPDFYYVTAASRDFGLTLGTRDTETIALTELGRELVYAPSPEVERTKKLEAFNKVELFKKVLHHYKGSNLPEMKYLGNTLEREFSLAPQYHESSQEYSAQTASTWALRPAWRSANRMTARHPRQWS
jgi:hypothetical protein